MLPVQFECICDHKKLTTSISVVGNSEAAANPFSLQVSIQLDHFRCTIRFGFRFVIGVPLFIIQLGFSIVNHLFRVPRFMDTPMEIPRQARASNGAPPEMPGSQPAALDPKDEE